MTARRFGDSKQSVRTRSTALLAGAALLLTLLLFWPGVAMFDSVTQYGQLLDDSFEDWHPPAMARLWSLLHPIADGQAPMFVLQVLLYWTGLGLIAAALAGKGRRWPAVAVLVLGLWPPLLGWEAAVIKDAQMASALLAAVGLVAWWRLRAARMPVWAIVLAALLIGYATLVRANAVFATVPLAVALVRPWSWRGGLPRALAIAVAVLVVLVASGWVNHQLLGARPTGVERTLPTFDLAGIAARTPPGAVPVLPPPVSRMIVAQRCASPILWDPLSVDARCGFVQNELTARAPGPALFRAWEAAILAHPLAYAAHRLQHWNATMRWIVPEHFPLAAPPASSEPNDLGLAQPMPTATLVANLAGPLARGPLGAPMLWFGAALATLAVARPARGAEHALAAALALSAVAMEASFLLVSIASDWRYHLWSMLAAGLAWTLLAADPPPRRSLRITAAALALLALSCLVPRLLLAPVGDSYQAAVAAR